MGSGQSIALQTRVAVCEKYTLGDTSDPVGQKPLKYWFLRLFTFLIGVSLMGLPIRSQEQRPDWQAEVRKWAEAQDWDSALRAIDREIDLAPQAGGQPRCRDRDASVSRRHHRLIDRLRRWRLLRCDAHGP